MKEQKSYCDRFRFAVGFVLAIPGLFLLAAHVITAADQFSRFLNQTASANLELVSSIMLVGSMNPHRLANGVLTILWPIVLVMSGGVVLKGPSERNADSCLGCA